MPRLRKAIPGVDPKLLIKDAAKLMPDPARRAFLRGGASVGALALLTGCDIIDGDAAEGVLRKMSRFNDRVAGAGCSIPTSSRRNIRRAPSRGRFRSTPITPERGARGRRRRTTSSRSAA